MYPEINPFILQKQINQIKNNLYYNFKHQKKVIATFTECFLCARFYVLALQLFTATLLGPRRRLVTSTPDALDSSEFSCHSCGQSC